MCCTCSGNCNHIGPHMYCEKHGGAAGSGYWDGLGKGSK